MASKKPETKFKEKVMRDIEAHYQLNVWQEKIQQVAIRGTPDLLICIHGFFVALELKSSRKEKPDELQAYKLHNISDAGGIAMTTSPETWPEDFELLKYRIEARRK